MRTFNLPDLGEGLAEAEVVEWMVQEGDTVKTDDPLVSMETAKAVVEVPSPYTGRILKVYGQKGDIIKTGAPFIDFEVDSDRKDTGTVVGHIEATNEVVQEKASSISSKSGGVKVLPAVRALAKKMEVDLASLTPSGPNNTITAEDVKQAAANLEAAGPIEPLKGVRRAMAQAMEQSHAEVVPVTIFDDVNISAWTDNDFTPRIIEAMCSAINEEGALNVWYDGKQMGRRVISDVNLGLAMDTKDGLFVPVIEAAQKKNRKALREEINQLKQEVQERTIKPARLKGASIVLSNFGKFAGRYASPIIVPPTVAILGVGSVREEVQAINGDPVVVKVLPLSISFDHRAVTGGEATRFLGHVMKVLSRP